MLRKLSLYTLKRSERLSDYDYFKTLDTLPIWNWYQYHKRHDLKYFLRLKDYSQTIVFTEDFKRLLYMNYDDLICDFDELNLEVMIAKRDYQVKLFELITNIAKNGNIFTDAEQMDAAFKLLIKLASQDDPEMEWLYKLPLKSPELRRALPEIARALIEYRKLKDRPTPEQDLMDKIVRINSELGVNIDEMTCSVRKFMAYQKQYIEKINVKNNALQ